MKNKNMILKKASKASRRRRFGAPLAYTPQVKGEETWQDSNIYKLNQRQFIKILGEVVERMGLKIQVSTHGNVRLLDELSQKQLETLLGEEES